MKNHNSLQWAITAFFLTLLAQLTMSEGPVRAASPQGTVSRASQSTARVSTLLVRADKAFQEGRYTEAADAYRQILKQDVQGPFYWKQYDQSVLAAAGDAYLQGLPADRLRIDSADFLQGRKTSPAGDFLLDIREPWEFAKGSIPGSINIPFRSLFHHLRSLPGPDSGKRIIIVCQTQLRANHALVTLREAGMNNAYTLKGGYKAYQVNLHRLKKGAGKPAALSGTRQTGSASQKTDIPAQNGKTALKDAANFLQNTRFELAVEILRAALREDHVNDALWSAYDRALLTMAGATYLRTLPDDRYRITTENFISQYIAGPNRFFLMDVRTPEAFAKGHIKGSVNIPFRTLLQHIGELPRKDSPKTILIICRSGHRAIHNLVVLRQMGYANAFILRGGLKALTHYIRKLPIFTSDLSTGAGNQSGEPEEEEDFDFGC